MLKKCEKLKQLFPEIVTEGKIDFEKLKAVLGEYVEKVVKVTASPGLEKAMLSGNPKLPHLQR